MDGIYTIKISVKNPNVKRKWIMCSPIEVPSETAQPKLKHTDALWTFQGCPRDVLWISQPYGRRTVSLYKLSSIRFFRFPESGRAYDTLGRGPSWSEIKRGYILCRSLCETGELGQDSQLDPRKEVAASTSWLRTRYRARPAE